MNREDGNITVEDKQYEKYLFYKVYTIDFDSALHTLRVLSRYRKNDVRYCLLRDVVVTYCRPFSNNRGHNLQNSLKSKKFVPQAFLPLHKELMAVRNQLFAHTDLTFRQPQVANWSTPEQIRFPMSFRDYEYAKLNTRVPEIKNLIAGAAQELRSEINKLEKNYADISPKEAAKILFLT